MGTNIIAQNLALLPRITGYFRTQRSERSRQLIENKDRSFFRTLESRQVTQNRNVTICKAVNLQKDRILANSERNGIL
jgi:hypothetical protein